MSDEIRLGPLTFSYERPGLTVSQGYDGNEEAIGYCEIVTPETWEEFHAAAAMGATVVQAMTPEEKAGPGELARIDAAMARMTQTMQMLGALSFQSYVLAMSIGRGLGNPGMHDVIRKDAADLENQAKELRKFITRLLYVRAGEEP